MPSVPCSLSARAKDLAPQLQSPPVWGSPPQTGRSVPQGSCSLLWCQGPAPTAGLCSLLWVSHHLCSPPQWGPSAWLPPSSLVPHWGLLPHHYHPWPWSQMGKGRPPDWALWTAPSRAWMRSFGLCSTRSMRPPPQPQLGPPWRQVTRTSPQSPQGKMCLTRRPWGESSPSHPSPR